ncbi:MAG: ribosome maturation factor RimM [Methylococcaceae bacterium]|nr:ribosome maturation factor RimM [Methylococcaceae bacterium]
MSDNELISVGEIAGVFGVKGWVKVFSHTEPRENILNYSPWILKKAGKVKEVKLNNGRRQGKTVVASIEGISDRDSAELYCGWEILINKSQLPETEDGVYYWADLVGLLVETEQGVALGVVDYLLETGANDVLVVKDGEQERLIPFINEQVIKKIDLDSKQMIVDWDPDF